MAWELAVIIHLGTLIFIAIMHRAISLPLRRPISIHGLFLQKLFAGFLLGDDVGSFIGHGSTVTVTAVTPISARPVVVDFAGATAGFGTTYDAALFQQVDQAGGS